MKTTRIAIAIAFMALGYIIVATPGQDVPGPVRHYIGWIVGVILAIAFIAEMRDDVAEQRITKAIDRCRPELPGIAQTFAIDPVDADAVTRDADVIADWLTGSRDVADVDRRVGALRRNADYDAARGVMPHGDVERFIDDAMVFYVSGKEPTRVTGMQLLNLDEVEYDGPATLHYPEGDR